MGAKVSSNATEVNVKKGTVITKSLFEITKLRLAIIKNQNMSSIPHALVEQTSYLPPIVDTLVELNLSNNSLNNLPAEIALLVNLRKLNLERNKLESLPEQFSALCNLEKLHLNSNNLKSLPVCMGNMKKLKVLMLHNNNLSWIQSEVSGLEALRELTIHNNPLGEELLSLDSLEKVMVHLLNSADPPEYVEKMAQFEKDLNIKKNVHELKSPALRAFQRLLVNEVHSDAFFEYLKNEYATESIQFYVESKSFESKFESCFPYTCTELVDAARDIYSNYIDESTTSERKVLINIPNHTKKKIDAAFGSSKENGLPREVNQWVFTDANISVLKLMYHDSFQRFIATPTGAKLWKKYDTTDKGIDSVTAKDHISKRLKALSTRKGTTHQGDKASHHSGDREDYYTF